MAISRRHILKLGVSYGTGTINFGNDSVVYDRALRKLPESTALEEFLEALSAAEDALAEEALAQEAANENGSTGSPAEEVGTVASEPAATEPPLVGADGEEVAPTSAEMLTETPSDLQEEPQEGEGRQGGEEADEAAPTRSPALEEALAKARAFQQLCSQLALSELYMQVRAMIGALEQDALPSVEETALLKERYDKIIDYLQHC